MKVNIEQVIVEARRPKMSWHTPQIKWPINPPILAAEANHGATHFLSQYSFSCGQKIIHFQLSSGLTVYAERILDHNPQILKRTWSSSYTPLGFHLYVEQKYCSAHDTHAVDSCHRILEIAIDLPDR